MRGCGGEPLSSSRHGNKIHAAALARREGGRATPNQSANRATERIFETSRLEERRSTSSWQNKPLRIGKRRCSGNKNENSEVLLSNCLRWPLALCVEAAKKSRTRRPPASKLAMHHVFHIPVLMSMNYYEVEIHFIGTADKGRASLYQK